MLRLAEQAFLPSRVVATTATAVAPLTTAPPPLQAIASATSRQSRIGLNATNFFLAEVGGVALPFANNHLRSQGWSFDEIGMASAMAGLGVLLMQVPAGVLVDRCAYRRGLLVGASLVVGICYGMLPFWPARGWSVAGMLFLAGVGHAFFGPLLGALALGLVGYERFNRTKGVNESWNHAGNLAAAVGAMVLVSYFGATAIFCAVTLASILAVGAVLLIRPAELDEARAAGLSSQAAEGLAPPSLFSLLRDRRVAVLLASTALFHLANAPAMPLVAMDVKHLGGSDRQVAAVVLVAQLVMIPVALAAAWLCDAWGRKRVLAVGFVALPLRIFLYSLAQTPATLVALQTLDGIGAGIYGVAAVAMCADLTRGIGCFNSLVGLLAAALALGGVVGPPVAGIMVEHLGFAAAFQVFAAIAAAAAALFVCGMRDTRRSVGSA
ncbi:MAG TPA: MFS transporter [Pirellulales bacterium]|nr:MFS transporter [Pirellulales bacterium]